MSRTPASAVLHPQDSPKVHLRPTRTEYLQPLKTWYLHLPRRTPLVIILFTPRNSIMIPIEYINSFAITAVSGVIL